MTAVPEVQDDRSSLLHAVQMALHENTPHVAKRICEQHLFAEPDDPDAHRYLGQLHVQLGEPERGLILAIRATELAPEDPRAWSDLGRVQVWVRKIAEAITCFERAVALAPDYADGWHNLGLALKQAGQTERAFEAMKHALLRDPTRADSYLTLGNLLVEHEQLDEALICFERAVAHDPQLARAQARLAQELSQRGDVERAQSLLKRSVALDPNDVGNWFDLARTLEDLGQAEAALSCYRIILQRQPGHALALGQYLALAKGDEGLEWLEQVEHVLDRPGDAHEGKALIGYGLIKFYDRRGRFSEAASAGIRANAARRKAAGPFDRDSFRTRVDAIIATYTSEFSGSGVTWG
ncbi:MAG: tetratricopeptide repeat protein [Nitrospira sp.]